MTVVDELVAILGFKVEGEKDLKNFRDGLDNAGKALGDFAKRAATFAAAAGAMVGAGIGYLGKAAISTGADFEKMETTLATIEGSSEKAKQSLDWVADFAAKTPYELNEVAEAFIRMRAYGLDPMAGQLEGVGNAASAMGKGLMQGVEAIADAVTGENERLKEFGIRASTVGDQITYSWQENGETLTKTVKKDGTEIANALMSIFGRFEGAMDAQSRTWHGMVANMGDQWVQFQKAIADAGWFDWMKDQMQELQGVFDRLWKDGTLKKVADEISGTLIAVGEELKATFSGITIDTIKDGILSVIYAFQGFVQLGKSIRQAFVAVADGINALAGKEESLFGLAVIATALGLAFAPMLTLFALVALATDDFIAWLDGRESVIGKVLEKLEAKFKDWGFDVDFSPEALKDTIKAWTSAIDELNVVLGVALAGSLLLLRRFTRSLSGSAGLFGKVPIFRIFMIGTAISTLIEAFAGTQNLEDFTSRLKDISVIEWTVIAAGILSLVGPIRTLGAAITTAMKPFTALSVGLGSLGALLLTSGSTAGNEYVEADADTRQRMRDDARTDTDTINGDYGRSGPRNPRRGQFDWIRERERALDDYLNPPAHRREPEQRDRTAPRASVPSIRDEAARANAESGKFEQMLAGMQQMLNKVTGDQAIEQTVSQISNDNRVTNVENNVSTVVHATTNASPQAIADSVSGGVQRSLRDPGRSLAVGGAPGGGGPR